MAFLKRYTDEFCLELSQKLNSSEIVDAYLAKDKFKFARDFEDFSEQVSDSPFTKDIFKKIFQAQTDFERGKILFETLANLTRREASDLGMWNYLSHNELYTLVHRMWPDIQSPPNRSSKESYILNHWIMTSSAQSELMDYPLSGLWWSFYLTVDDTREDKYELTKIFFKNLSFRTKLFGQSKIARHKEAVIAVLEFIQENGLDQKNFEDNGKAIVPYLNLSGGIRPLGAFDRNWYREKLKKKFQKDITEYGRLFRRDEKKESLKLAPVLVEENIDEKVPPIIEEQEFEETKSFIYVENQTLIVSNNPRMEMPFGVESKLNDPHQALFIIYKNGLVKKISSQVLIFQEEDKPIQLRPSTSDVLAIFYTNQDNLILACSLSNIRKRVLKVFPGSKIPFVGFDENPIPFNRDNNQLRVTILPKAYQNLVPSLIKSYPEASFSFESVFLKEEISRLKQIIEENKMYQ
jgi:hypothetical protein